MRNPVSRRSFLLASAGLVVGAACGGNGKDGPIAVDKPTTTAAGSVPRDLSLVVASYVHVAGIDERVTVALIRESGPFKADGPVPITIDGAPVEAKMHQEGIALPYFLLRHRFDKPGVHDIKATVGGRELSAAVTVVDPAAAKVPYPGKPLIKVPTPTVVENRGVSPICTMRPTCPLHDVSLDAALDEKKPLAVLFATPALCQSQLCGPVLENLLAVRDEFSGKVRMLHVEIFTDLQGQTSSPAVKAYGLESEPFLFLAGADGVVRDRLDNAYDRTEVREALTRLTA